ncbi:hypothetical protein KGA66_21080 [Actinocrinis puniceicyclus]|uniref:ABC3 transporter permease C-terminal domain-containing protein n=1 Tax=Actinocrinis puniceicyclus TaxID=977794 RepID=A0A8J8BCW6_9ACTN|nr:FtsX-like permease family protein [Actinocrinis puniceicyclus]MBS2965557.1 hypothetical protein [Actinocrinis puniceicyclus]
MNAGRALRDARYAAAVAWRRPALAGLAVLTALVCLAITALARIDFAARTSALHMMIADAPPTAGVIHADADWMTFLESQGVELSAATGASERIRQALAEAGLPVPAAPPSNGAASDGASSIAAPAGAATEPWTTLQLPEQPIEAPPGAAKVAAVPARMRLVYRDTYADHSRLVAGRRPTTARQRADAVLETDLSVATAKRLGLGLGSTLTVLSPGQGGTVRLVVVGLVTARDPGSAFWASDGTLAGPQLEADASGDQYWATAALIGPAQAQALTTPPPGSHYLSGITGYRLSFDFPLDLSGLDADGAGSLADRLDALPAVESRLDFDPAGSIPVVFDAELTPILRAFAAAQQTATLEQAMPLCGLALIAAIAGALLAFAAVDRRRGEAAVLRARGAATRHLVLAALGESGVTVLPAAAAAFAAGFAVPGKCPSWAYTAAVAAGLCATLSPVLCTALIHRPHRSARPQLNPRGSARFARHRRLIVHGALAAACAAGLSLVGGQGLTPDGGSLDPYAAAAPVLAATLGALVTVNALPPVLRALRRRALRQRGIVALLGVARAAQEPGLGQAATFVLTTAACTADLAVALSRLGGHADPTSVQRTLAGPLELVAVSAIVAAAVAAALAVRLGAAARRDSDARLATMGLTTGQARAVAAAENVPPALAGALTGALVTAPLLRLVAPALGVGAIPASPWSLALPALAVALPAAAASAVGTWRRGAR